MTLTMLSKTASISFFMILFLNSSEGQPDWCQDMTGQKHNQFSIIDGYFGGNFHAFKADRFSGQDFPLTPVDNGFLPLLNNEIDKNAALTSKASFTLTSFEIVATVEQPLIGDGFGIIISPPSAKSLNHSCSSDMMCMGVNWQKFVGLAVILYPFNNNAHVLFSATEHSNIHWSLCGPENSIEFCESLTLPVADATIGLKTIKVQVLYDQLSVTICDQQIPPSCIHPWVGVTLPVPFLYLYSKKVIETFDLSFAATSGSIASIVRLSDLAVYDCPLERRGSPYFLTNTPETWISGHKRCEQQGAYLAPIRSDEQVTAISRFMRIHYETDISAVLVGVYQECGRFWAADGLELNSLCSDLCFDNPENRTSCAKSSLQNSWRMTSVECDNPSETSPSLCFNYTAVMAQSPTNRVPNLGGPCDVIADGSYFAIEQNVTALEAVELCSGKGGRLATIKNAQEIAAISSFLASQSRLIISNFWIGLFEECDGVRWADGELVNNGELSNSTGTWAYGEPNNNMENQRCVMVDKLLEMRDINCDRFGVPLTICFKPFANETIRKPDLSDCETTTSTSTTTTAFESLHLIANSMTGLEAIDSCYDMGGYLATLKNEGEIKMIKNFMASQSMPSSFHTWMGLFEECDGVRWADGEFVNAGEFSKNLSAHWDSGEPNNLNGNDRCTVFEENLKWHDVPCNKSKFQFALCFVPPSIQTIRKPTFEKCQQTSTTATTASGFGSYVLIHKNMTAMEAIDTCHEEGGYLATMKNDQEIAMAESFLSSTMSSISTFWIGLFEECDGVRWADGELVNAGEFSNATGKWRANEPNNFLTQNERCVMATRNMEWIDMHCNYKQMSVPAALCFIPKSKDKIRKPVVSGCEQTTLAPTTKSIAGSLILIRENLTGMEAIDACNQKGGNLATMKNENESEAIRDLLDSESINGTKLHFWIGLYEECNGVYWADGTWVNSGGFSNKTGNWTKNQPNNDKGEEKCVASSVDLELSDYMCTKTKLPYAICQLKPLDAAIRKPAITNCEIIATQLLAIKAESDFFPDLYSYPQSPSTKMTTPRLIRECQDVNPYNRAPPAFNSSSIQIHMKFTVDRFVGIDDVNQEVTVTGQLYTRWAVKTCKSNQIIDDERVLVIPSIDAIWHPVLSFANAVEDLSMKDATSYLDDMEFLYLTNNEDQLRRDIFFYWKKRGMFRASCGLDLWKFPFDEQTCSFDFTLLDSWNLTNISEIALRVSDFTLEPGNEMYQMWTFKPGSAKIINDPDKDQVAVFEIKFIRNPHYYIFNLLLPSLVLTVLSFATFFMPSSNSDRVCFTVYMVLAFAVTQSQLLSKTPRTTQRILLVDYVQLLQLVCALITCHTIFMMWHSASKSSKVVPSTSSSEIARKTSKRSFLLNTGGYCIAGLVFGIASILMAIRAL